MRSVQFLSASVTAALVVCLSVNAALQRWSDDFVRCGGGFWQSRIKVELCNLKDVPLTGYSAALRVGGGEKELPLEGVRVEELRVSTAEGVEVLFAVFTPQGLQLTSGRIPEGALIAFPVSCKPGESSSLYVYWNNPLAEEIPDFLNVRPFVLNGSFESGGSEGPFGWKLDPGDSRHRVSWTDSEARTGAKSVVTEVEEGASPSWIAARQRGLSVFPGCKYEFRAWVKARDVKGTAGWYLHFENEKGRLLEAPVLRAGSGTFNWREVKSVFTVPPQAVRLSFGTVLRGTGTAWFDDVTVRCMEPAVEISVGKEQKRRLKFVGGKAPWPKWGEWRCAVRAIGDGGQRLVAVDLPEGLQKRMRGGALCRVYFQGRSVPHFLLGSALLFRFRGEPGVVATHYVYLKSRGPSKTSKPQGGFDLSALLSESGNLVRNGSFEEENLGPAWKGVPPQSGSVSIGVVKEGLRGGKCLRLYVPPDLKPAWRGIRQSMRIEPGGTYLVCGYLKGRDLSEEARLHIHFKNERGALSKILPMTSVGPGIRGSAPWRMLHRIVSAPEDATVLQLHLTIHGSGTVFYDDIAVLAVSPGRRGRWEGRPADPSEGLKVWAVNPIVKVFPFDLPGITLGAGSAAASSLRVWCARGEREPLQLAFRSGRPIPGLTIRTKPVLGPEGAAVCELQTALVGLVPVDYPTNYYRSTSPEWIRKRPKGSPGSDGWPGLWPDPLLPVSKLDLPANETRAVWITFTVPARASPGEYRTVFRFEAGGKTLVKVPVGLRVWDFTLPEKRHVAAIYDIRLGPGGKRFWGGSLEEVYPQIAAFMAERRLCADTVRPAPRIAYRDGRVEADFAAFDKAADWYFSELKMPFSYTPWYFYCFGWGHPPGLKFGQRPYPGPYPYRGADRGRLREEFKKAYQACLSAFWEHLKEKGWSDRFILYISDEPYYRDPAVIKQMKALCDMVHEVDPRIPIYSSTWRYVPAWKDYLNVWGLGHAGHVPPETFSKIRKDGARVWFTTDGQMCLDTPYCAVERLLPYYCFKYGVEAYEFWGAGWLTYNPFRFGWHSYIRQSGRPGESFWVRYPNGDGFILYPGRAAGFSGVVSSVRCEQASQGVEDYEYLFLAGKLLKTAAHLGPEERALKEALERAEGIVSIPNAGGRYSTRILPDPDLVPKVRIALGDAIEAVVRKRRSAR